MNLKGVLAQALALGLCSSILLAELPVQSTATFVPPDQVRLSWTSVPGQSYQVKSTAELSTPWTAYPTDPAVLVAPGEELSVNVPVADAARFFRVVKLDTDPPALLHASPGENAIAVGREQEIWVLLQDETGFDTNAIRFTVGTVGPLSLADSRLAFANGELTYTPTPQQPLGGLEETVNVTLVAADPVGNATNYTWSFQTELPTVLRDNVLVVGGGNLPSFQSRGLTAPNDPGLVLISKNGSFYTYTYSGPNSGLVDGSLIIDPSWPDGEVVRVLSFIDDPPSRTVVARVEPASVAEAIESGSVRFQGAGLPEYPLGPVLADELEVNFAWPLEFPLDDTVLYEQDGVKLELINSQVDLTPELQIRANFRDFRPSEIDIDLYGTTRLGLSLRGTLKGGQTWADSTTLWRKTYVKAGLIGYVPIWVQADLKLDLGYEARLDTDGLIEVGADIEQGFGFLLEYRRDRAEEWTLTTRQHRSWQPREPVFRLGGDYYAQVYLRPDVDVQLYSVVGAGVYLQPNLELEGTWQPSPPSADWTLYGSVPGAVELRSRVWPEAWGELPAWEFALLEKTEIASGRLGAPLLTSQPASRTVEVGQSVSFTVSVKGTGPFTYGWQKDGEDLTDDGRISRATFRWLTIRDARWADAGQYRCVVSNNAGEVISEAATLTVQGGGEPQPVPGMVWIAPGAFTMGSPSTESGRSSDEGPQTQVTLTQGFWLGRYEVTQREYLELMGNNPSRFTGDLDRPVEQVSWNEAVAYCEKLTQRERTAGRLPAGYAYGLPTEAQWEYACRAGTTTRYSWGDSDAEWVMKQYCWYEKNADDGYWTVPHAAQEGPQPVGSLKPNSWGLYDMHGNVWEWCADWYDTYYPGGSVTDPGGPSSAWYRVIRGGCWYYDAPGCRSAYRYWHPSSFTHFGLGFRVSLVPVP